MSYDDFIRMDLDAFMEVLKVYNEKEEERERGEWERMRILAAITIQPHITSRMSPETLVPLPWDNETQGDKPAAKVQEISKEEKQKRMQEIAEQYNQENK